MVHRLSNLCYVPVAMGVCNPNLQLCWYIVDHNTINDITGHGAHSSSHSGARYVVRYDPRGRTAE